MKRYNVILENKVIGTTLFEKADAAMGVVAGLIELSDDHFDYDFLKAYCLMHRIQLALDDPEYRAIGTTAIPELQVISEDGTRIAGQGVYIEGIEKEGFEVTVLGYPYPDYENEFPHHVREYDERFKA